MSKIKYKKLSTITLPPISGNRPPGGVNSSDDGIPSFGGENILMNGGVLYDDVKTIPIQFYKYMPKGKLEKHDVLINKDGAQTGKLGIYNGYYSQAAINEHLFILRIINKEMVDPIYMYYALLLPETKLQIDRRITGSAQPGINSSFAHHVQIPFYSFIKQQKIARILSTTDKAIEKTEAIIQKYQQIKQGLMHDLFTRGVTPDGKLRPTREQAPGLYKQTPIGWIPTEWDTDSIANLFFIQLGKMLSKKAKSGKHSAHYLGNKNVQWDTVELTKLETMDFIPSERDKYNLKLLDLLVCEGGDVGRTAMWRGELPNCYYQKAIHRLRAKNKRIKPELMLRFMRYAKNRGFFTNYTSQTSIAHLTQEKLEKVTVCIPSQKEQNQLVSIFNSIDQKIDFEIAYKEELETQRIGLMHDLLTGTVKVTVDE